VTLEPSHETVKYGHEFHESRSQENDSAGEAQQQFTRLTPEG
jgi:hypothetical protein